MAPRSPSGLLARVFRLGVDPSSVPHAVKHVVLTNAVSFWGTVLAVTSAINAQVDPRFQPVRHVLLVWAILDPLPLLLNALRRHLAASCWFVGLNITLTFVTCCILPDGCEEWALFVGMAGLGLFLFEARRRWVGAVFAAGAVVAHLSVGLVQRVHAPLALSADDVAKYAFGNRLLGFFIVLVGSISAVRETSRVERELDHERERADGLLSNVLPPRIAERLKADPGAIAERFERATVLFADIVRFTSLAERTPPIEIVAMLDRVFTRFDELADAHGLEKIKTIGDAYMVAGGIPEAREDHAVAIADMALAMRAALCEMDVARRHDLAIRIGIHTGPVVAGVIGKRKLLYDLWGDTVNTASRMESHGTAGKIQVTEAVRNALAGDFDFEEQGIVEIKGKGPMPTFFLVARKV